MSETARKLFESLKGVKEAVEAIAPGLKSLVPDVKAEMTRLGTQGAMELASALFSNHSFVPYGPGQYTPSVSNEHHHEHEHSRQGHGMER